LLSSLTNPATAVGEALTDYSKLDMFSSYFRAYYATHQINLRDNTHFSIPERLFYLQQASLCSAWKECFWLPIATTFQGVRWNLPPSIRLDDQCQDSMEGVFEFRHLPLVLRNTLGGNLHDYKAVPCPRVFQCPTYVDPTPIRQWGYSFHALITSQAADPFVAYSSFFLDQTYYNCGGRYFDSGAGATHRGRAKAYELMTHLGQVGGTSVLDLGGAPGGFASVFSARNARVTTVSSLSGVSYWASVRDDPRITHLYADLHEYFPGRHFDFVVSDACPSLDSTSSVERDFRLAPFYKQAFRIALEGLRHGGVFALKMILGATYPAIDILYMMSHVFDKVELVRLSVSRQTGAEFYAIGRGYRPSVGLTVYFSADAFFERPTLCLSTRPPFVHRFFVEALMSQQLAAWKGVSHSQSQIIVDEIDPVVGIPVNPREILVHERMFMNHGSVSCFLASGVVLRAYGEHSTDVYQGVLENDENLDEYVNVPFFDTIRETCLSYDYVIPLAHTMFSTDRLQNVVGYSDGDIVNVRLPCRNEIVIIRSYESHFALVQLKRKECFSCHSLHINDPIKIGDSGPALPTIHPVPAYVPDFQRGPQFVVPMLPVDVDPPIERRAPRLPLRVRFDNGWNGEDFYEEEAEDSDDDVDNDHYFEMDAPDYQVRAMYRGEGDEFDVDPWVFFW